MSFLFWREADTCTWFWQLTLYESQLREAIDYVLPDDPAEQNETTLVIAYLADPAKAHFGIDLNAWIEDYLAEEGIRLCAGLSEGRQFCRVCGCSWNRACAGGCYWVEADLCSSCAKHVRRVMQS